MTHCDNMTTRLSQWINARNRGRPIRIHRPKKQKGGTMARTYSGTLRSSGLKVALALLVLALVAVVVPAGSSFALDGRNGNAYVNYHRDPAARYVCPIQGARQSGQRVELSELQAENGSFRSRPTCSATARTCSRRRSITTRTIRTTAVVLQTRSFVVSAPPREV